jgi:A/G-specific adenine glycosylase
LAEAIYEMKIHPRQPRFGHRAVELLEIDFFRQTLLHWWRYSRREFPWRLERASAYHRIVSEVLLQRTRAETVAAFWPSFVGRYPSWKAVAKATSAQIERFLRPIGLAKQRAPRLHALAVTMAGRKGRFPARRDEIEELPGVGQYIANAVFTLCHNTPEPLLDVNMARVVERFFGPRKLADIRYDPYLQDIARHIVRHPRGKVLNWAILDFAAKVCRARKPDCQSCPISAKCVYFQRVRRTPQQHPSMKSSGNPMRHRGRAKAQTVKSS